MSSVHTEVRAALVQAVQDADLDIPVAYENVQFDKPDSPPWAAFKIVPVTSGVATLGQGGEDEHRGYAQLDLNYEKGSGELAINAKADEVASHFVAGLALSSGSTTVHVRSCSRSPGREAEGFWRVSMTIYYYARTPRN